MLIWCGHLRSLRFSACISGLVSHAVFPEGGPHTCDASSRQRSHWCCRHACAQVQLFIDWGQQSKWIWCFVLSVTCRCEVSQVHISVSAQLSALIVILHVVSICVGTCICDRHFVLSPCQISWMHSSLQCVWIRDMCTWSKAPCVWCNSKWLQMYALWQVLCHSCMFICRSYIRITCVPIKMAWGDTCLLSSISYPWTTHFTLLCHVCVLLLFPQDGRDALHLAADGGRVSTLQYLAPKMESLLHCTDISGNTMLHSAAGAGHAAVVQLVIDEYKLDPNAHDKVCGQTCRCLAKSSRASGGLCDGRWHVIDVYEHGLNWDRFIEWWQWLGVGCMLYSESSLVLSVSTSSYEFCMMMRCEYLPFLHSLTFTHARSCLLLFFLKMGMTPVMLAALKGHTGVVDMLVHKYNCSLSEVDNVSAFDGLCCQSPVGVKCHKYTSESLPNCQCWLSFCM